MFDISQRRAAIPRSPAFFAVGVVIGIAGALLWGIWILAGIQNFSGDATHYYDAAHRLIGGQDLYIPPIGGDPDIVPFRYAPWWAAVWVPLLILPRALACALWVVALLAISAVALRNVVASGTGGIALAWLVGPHLVYTSLVGNVQPLIVVGLLYTVGRRAGPLAIAAAASLKLTPLAFVLVYAGRREWIKVAVTVILTAVLVAPILLFNLTNYSTAFEYTIGLVRVSAPLFATIAMLAAVAAFLAARSRYAWVAAGLAAISSLPQLLMYDITYLLIGLAEPPSGRTTPPESRPVSDRQRLGSPREPEPRRARPGRQG